MHFQLLYSLDFVFSGQLFVCRLPTFLGRDLSNNADLDNKLRKFSTKKHH